MLQRYFIHLAYNGTRFHGWQVQSNAKSIQEELNINLSKITGESISTIGAGRTDTGVHASCFYAHFDSDKTDLEDSSIVYRLNRMLHPDIVVYKIFNVSPDAHARFDAISRTYQYHINILKDPFQQEFSYYLPYKLDIELMNQASLSLYNYIDFSCFSKSRTQVLTNNCKVINCNWEQSENRLTFEIRADRFLRNMVRAIVGTLLEVGQGRMNIKQFEQVIESKSRSMAGLSVPASGLFLTDIKYPEGFIKTDE